MIQLIDRQGFAADGGIGIGALAGTAEIGIDGVDQLLPVHVRFPKRLLDRGNDLNAALELVFQCRNCGPIMK